MAENFGLYEERATTRSRKAKIQIIASNQSQGRVSGLGSSKKSARQNLLTRRRTSDP